MAPSALNLNLFLGFRLIKGMDRRSIPSLLLIIPIRSMSISVH